MIFSITNFHIKEDAMILKRPLCPQRIRKPPAGFGWLDHRLVRDGYIELCSHPAAALYLFLVTVADARGLSYYSDDSVMERLRMDSAALYQARRDLVAIGLIAYQKPLYQVLALDGGFGPAPVAELPGTSSAYRPAENPSYRTENKSSTGPAAKPSVRDGMQSVKEILKTIMEDPQ
jgi:hypothetical protein